MIVIPFKPSIAHYDLRCVLLDVEYIFNVRWNSLDGAWFFDVLEIDSTPIVYGIKAVLGAYYGRTSTHRLFTDGAMVARVPHGDDRREAGFDDMGTRVQICYFNRDEAVEEIVASLRGRRQ